MQLVDDGIGTEVVLLGKNENAILEGLVHHEFLSSARLKK
jgi:hypothetical protein